ncbi:OOP family OmpA-OmpF porin [Oceanicella actignis]|nr:OOP family OmpA-OmpF porin [Oceanicella actignis]
MGMERARAGLAAAIGAAVLAAGAGAWGLSGWIEERTRAQVSEALADHPWVRAQVDGALVRASGRAPDERAAMEVLEALARIGGFTRLRSEIEAPQAGARPRAEPPRVAAPARAARLVLTRRGREVTISGAAPAPAAGALGDALREAGQDLRISDVSLPEAAPAPDGWLAAERLAARALALLEDATVEIAPGRVGVRAAAPSAKAAAEAERALEAARPEGVQLDLSISAPPPRRAPFSFALLRTAQGWTLERCHAADRDDARRIEAALRAASPEGFDGARCEPALGAPSERWADAALAGISALATLPAGRFALEDSRAALEALPPTDADAFARAGRGLSAALDGAFSLALSGPGAVEQPPAPPVFAARLSRGGALALAGTAPDEATRGAVVSLARSLAGGHPVSDGLRASGAAAVDPAWRRAALAALSALLALDEGVARYDGASISLAGRARSAEALVAMKRALAEAPADGLQVLSRVTIDLPAAAAELPLGPARCAEALSAIVAATPLNFAPGSAAFAPGAEATLDALAATFGRCRGGVVEIQGHTDSQGREETNLALSRARAEAVLAAMQARGVSLTVMRARGYGESAPVAPNDTEEGRARNRRIAFAPWAPGGGQEDGR